MKSTNTWEQTNISNNASLFELYHENSKQNLFWSDTKDIDELKLNDLNIHSSLPLAYLEEIALPAVPNEQIFEKLNGLEYLSALLQKSYGFSQDAQLENQERVLQSQNGLYPLEIYVLSHKLDGVQNGLWHYNIDQHAISLLELCGISRLEKHMSFSDSFKSGIALFITAEMSTANYLQGERSYRHVLIECGKALQNVYSFSKSTKTHYEELLNFNEYEIENFLNIDGVNHILLSGCLLGMY